MKILPFKKKIWIVSKEEGSIYNGICLKKSGNSISLLEYRQFEDPKELSSKSVYLTFFSERTLITNDTFVSAKRDILELQIDERVKNVGPWADGTRLHHSLFLLSKGERQDEYIVLSTPELDIERVVDDFSGFRIKGCFPHIAAISALVGQLTDEAVISCFLSRGLLEVIVSKDSIPYYSQISPFDIGEGLEFEVLAQTIFSVRQIIGSKLKENVKKILFFDRNFTSYPEKIGSESTWNPDLSNLIKAGDETLFYRFPDLLGTIFCDKNFDCLPASIKKKYFFNDLNKAVTTISATCSIFLALALPKLNTELKSSLENYQKVIESIRNEKLNIEKEIPSHQDTQKLQEIIGIWNEIQEEPNLSTALIDISSLLPDKVIIAHMKIEREGPKGQEDMTEEGVKEISEPDEIIAEEINDVGPEENILKDEKLIGTLKMHLTLFCQGDFHKVKNKFEQTISSLKQHFRVKKIKWGYQEEKDSGLLYIEIPIEKDGNEKSWS